MKLKPRTDKRLRAPADVTHSEITKYFAGEIPLPAAMLAPGKPNAVL